MENQNLQILETEIAEYENRFKQRKEHGIGQEVQRNYAKYYFITPDDKLSVMVGAHDVNYSKMNSKKLIDFVIAQPSNNLNLTWLDHQDKIILCSNTQYHRMTRVEVNIDNLLGSFLPNSNVRGLLKSKTKSEFHKKHFVVHGENARLSFVQQIKAFASLLSLNHKDIQSITLHGFNHMMSAILSGYAKTYGVALTKNEKAVATSEMVY